MKKCKFIACFLLFLLVMLGMIQSPVSADNTVTPKIEAGWFSSLALKSDGTVWAWGGNSNCQYGNNSTISSNTSIQIKDNITDISAGQYHSLFLKSDGTVWGCGSNLTGELGNGTTTTCKVPVEVSNLTGVVAISNLGAHSLALKSDGTVWAWGKNNYGQLGNGTTNNSSVPTQVSNLTDVIAISSGYWSSLALKSDGTVWVWGQQCPTMICSNVPVKVTNLTGIIAISAGMNNYLVLKSDGTVWSWGFNGYGQLGNGSTTNSTTPVQVSGLSGVSAISVKGNHALALKSDGTVWAWGHNQFGQLGNGSTTNSTTPGKVTNLTGIIAISAGGNHSLALKSDGTVWSWGYNYSGQLGDGTNVSKTIRIQVVDNSTGFLNLLQNSNTIPITGITLDADNMNLFVGDSETLTATVQPSNASNKNVSWWSSEPGIATVDSTGKVTGVTVGNAIIRVTAQDGSYTTACNVTVIDAEAPEVSTQGDFIVLKDPEFLVPVTYDCAAGFTVTENGVDVPVTGVRVYDGIDGWTYSEIELTLQRPVTVGSDVVINYVFDPEHPIAVRSGSSLGGSSGETHYYTLPSTSTTVVNYSAQPVTISHSTVTVAGDGQSMHIVLPAAVHTYNYTGSAGFYVSSDGTPITITRVVTSGRGVDVYFGDTIPVGSSVSVGYEPMPEYPITTVVGGSQIVLGDSGGSGSSTTTISVPNASTAPIIFGPPTVSSDEQTVTIPSPINLPDVTYDGNAGFRVFSDDGEIPIIKVEIKGNQIILYLGTPLIGNGTFMYNSDPDQPVSWDGGKTDIPDWISSAVEYIEIIPTEYIANVGETKQLQVKAHLKNGSIPVVTDFSMYMSDHTETAAVDSKGIVTAESPGIANITATFYGKTATCKVIVITGQYISVTGITLDVNDLQLALGETKTLIATITPINATNQKLIWVSSNPSIAKVDENGKVTGIKPGFITVTVTTEDGNLSATCTVTVIPAASTIQSLLVFPTPINLLVGQNQQITVKARYSDGIIREVTPDATYISNKPEMAAMDATNANQVNGIAVGSATVTVSYEGKSVNIPVTVSNPVAKSLFIEPSPINVAVGMTQAIKVIARLSNGTTLDVTNQATLLIADNTRAIISDETIAGIHQGTTKLTAAYQGISATAMVFVQAPIVQSLKVSPNPINIAVGKTSDVLVVKAIKSDGTEEIIPNNKVQFSLGTSGIASITGDYRVLGKTVGTSVLTANYSGLTAQTNVNVDQALIERIVVNPNPISITIGKSVAVTATVVYSDGSQQTVQATMTPHESNAGFIISNNQLTGTVVGSYNLDVTYGDLSVKVPVAVTAATVESISFSDIAVGVGQSKAIQAIAHLSDGTTQDITGVATYSLMNSSIASITGSQITGKSSGTTLLTVKYQGMTANANVTVTAPVATGLTVSPNPISCSVGDSVALTVTATMSDGTTKNVTTLATYGNSNQIVDVNSNGLMLALKAGTGEIVVMYNGSSVNVPVTVTAQLKPLSIPQNNYYILITSAMSNDVNVKFTLASSNTSIVTVPSPTGNRVFGKRLGTATITVSYYNSQTGVSGSYQIPVQVTSIPVNKPK